MKRLLGDIKADAEEHVEYQGYSEQKPRAHGVLFLKSAIYGVCHGVGERISRGRCRSSVNQNYVSTLFFGGPV